MIDKNSYIKTSNKLLREVMYKVYKGKCFYTGVTIEDFEIDHIYPKSLGGKDCISNYVLCSKGLNRTKYNRTNATFCEVIAQTANLLYVDKIINLINKKLAKKKSKKLKVVKPRTYTHISESNIRRGLKTKLLLIRAIENWDFIKFGKITYIKLAENLKISRATIARKKDDIRGLVINMNKNFADNK